MGLLSGPVRRKRAMVSGDELALDRRAKRWHRFRAGTRRRIKRAFNKRARKDWR